MPGDERDERKAPDRGPHARVQRPPWERDGWGEVHALPHVNLDAHPGMNATLERVFSFRETEDIEMAALENPGLRHRDRGKTTCTFGDDVFAGPSSPGTNPSTKLLLLSIRQLTNSHLIIPVMCEFGSRFSC